MQVLQIRSRSWQLPSQNQGRSRSTVTFFNSDGDKEAKRWRQGSQAVALPSSQNLDQLPRPKPKTHSWPPPKTQNPLTPPQPRQPPITLTPTTANPNPQPPYPRRQIQTHHNPFCLQPRLRRGRETSHGRSSEREGRATERERRAEKGEGRRNKKLIF